MKHLVRSLAAGAGVLALALSGCTATADGGETAVDDAQAPAEITFLTFQSPALTEEFWEEQVAEVQKLYPNLTVNIEYTPDLDRQAYAKQLLATGNLPDVIWDVPLADFVDAGALLPYEPSDLENIDVPAGTGQIDGENYTLTLGAQVIPMVYYNADVFAELGIEVPTTFDEMIDAAETIKDAGQVPFLIGGGADTWATTLFLDGIITADVFGANPEWATDRRNGDVSFQDADMKAAVEKWLGLFEAGYFNEDALTVDYSQLVTKFSNGEGVMYPMGTWAGASTTNFDAGVFPLPTEDGSAVFGLNYGQALAISADTEFPAQARAFAVALATGEGANLANLVSDSLIPVVKGFNIPSDVAPLIAETVEAYRTEGAVKVEPFGWTQGANALPSGFTDEFNKGAQNLLLGTITVADFLAEMDRVYDDLSAG